MAKKNKIRTKTANIDYGLLGALILLAAFGLVMGYSASGYLAAKKGLDVYWFFAKQGLIGGVCFLAALLISKADYHVLWYLRWLMMAGAAGSILLLMVDRFSVNKNGATRWLEFFGVSVQPSEIAKIALIVFVPAIAVKMGQEFKGILPSIAALIPGTLLAAETYLISKDLSSAVIIFAIGFFITFAAHPKSYGFFIVGAVVLIAAAAGVFYIWSRVTPDAAESFRVTRLLIWKDPAAFEGGTGEQTIMGLYAIGNGGLFG
ncbi:MAG: FtsW/RodA/SpoVE family cell cycle protein, partial [Lachnospiraceae bacterium]|nr:FtsW/RodA/SpoVE family cell cycle protein [Lachnospiraceae bacterium]